MCRHEEFEYGYFHSLHTGTMLDRFRCWSRWRPVGETALACGCGSMHWPVAPSRGGRENSSCLGSDGSALSHCFALKCSLVFQEKTVVARTSQTSKDETLKSALRSGALTQSMLTVSDSRRPLRQTQSLRERWDLKRVTMKKSVLLAARLPDILQSHSEARENIPCSVLNGFTSICVNLCLFAEKIIKEKEAPARVSNYSIQQIHDNGMRLVMHRHTPQERHTSGL